MINKKFLTNSLVIITPDQQDFRGHCLFDRNKQKSKLINIRELKNTLQLKFENLAIINH
jgi:hypothetical protein